MNLLHLQIDFMVDEKNKTILNEERTEESVDVTIIPPSRTLIVGKKVEGLRRKDSLGEPQQSLHSPNPKYAKITSRLFSPTAASINGRKEKFSVTSAPSSPAQRSSPEKHFKDFRTRAVSVEANTVPQVFYLRVSTPDETQKSYVRSELFSPQMKILKTKRKEEGNYKSISVADISIGNLLSPILIADNTHGIKASQYKNKDNSSAGKEEREVEKGIIKEKEDGEKGVIIANKEHKIINKNGRNSVGVTKNEEKLITEKKIEVNMSKVFREKIENREEKKAQKIKTDNYEEINNKKEVGNDVKMRIESDKDKKMINLLISKGMVRTESKRINLRKELKSEHSVDKEVNSTRKKDLSEISEIKASVKPSFSKLIGENNDNSKEIRGKEETVEQILNADGGWKKEGEEKGAISLEIGGENFSPSDEAISPPPSYLSSLLPTFSPLRSTSNSSYSKTHSGSSVSTSPVPTTAGSKVYQPPSTLLSTTLPAPAPSTLLSTTLPTPSPSTLLSTTLPTPPPSTLLSTTLPTPPPSSFSRNIITTVHTAFTPPLAHIVTHNRSVEESGQKGWEEVGRGGRGEVEGEREGMMVGQGRNEMNEAGNKKSDAERETVTQEGWEDNARRNGEEKNVRSYREIRLDNLENIPEEEDFASFFVSTFSPSNKATHDND